MVLGIRCRGAKCTFVRILCSLFWGLIQSGAEGLSCWDLPPTWASSIPWSLRPVLDRIAVSFEPFHSLSDAYRHLVPMWFAWCGLNSSIPWSTMNSVYTTSTDVSCHEMSAVKRTYFCQKFYTFNKFRIIFKSLSCRWVKSNTSCINVSKKVKTSSMCCLKKVLAFSCITIG